jgi:hypothetical protein
MSIFFQRWRTGMQNRSCLGSWYQWEGEDIKKGCRKVNMEEILCTMYVNGKMRDIETIPGIGRWGIKENDGGDEFKYDIL